MLRVRRLVAIAVVSTIAAPALAKPTPKPGAPKAAAKAPPATPEEAEARKHFEIGLKLYNEKLYEAALTEFEQSYALVPRPSALRNVAQSQRDLKRFAEAHAAFTQLLEKHGPQLSKAELEAVQRAIKELESVTGTISIAATEPDALVTIDGREIGKTPLQAPVRADVGPRVVRVAKPGFEPFEATVKVVATKSLSVDAVLEKDVKTGKLTIKEKTGRKAKVFVDDKEVGVAPWTGDVAPGSHVVELRGEGVASPKRTIEVAAKAESEVVLEATPMRGHLRIETLGKEGTIFVDDEKVGEGTWEGDLAPGAHRVKVEASGYQPHERLVAIVHGQTVVEAVTLVPIGGRPGLAPGEIYRGLFARAALVVPFGVSGAGERLSPSCDSGPACDRSFPLVGAGAALHVGYSFGILSAEVVGAFLADYQQIKRSYGGQPGSPGYPTRTGDPVGNMARDETYDLYGFAGFGGLGGRVTSKDDAVRFTFGAAFGAAYRSQHFRREAGDEAWKPPAVSGWSPGLFLDAGLLLGSTPGTKLTIGVVAWMDFPGKDLVTEGVAGGRNISTPTGTTAKIPSDPQVLRSGSQIYVGPSLGVQFGR